LLAGSFPAHPAAHDKILREASNALAVGGVTLRITGLVPEELLVGGLAREKH
jgi:hypothetical protein